MNSVTQSGAPSPSGGPPSAPVGDGAADPTQDASRATSYFESLTGRTGVVRVEDRDLLRDLVMEASGAARREVCGALPGGPYPAAMMRQSWEEDVALLERGVTAYLLYQADAVRTPDLLRYLSEFVAAGVNARIAPRVDRRLLLFDRSVAFVGLEPDGLNVPALMVREPVLVQSIQTRFAHQWRAAHAVGVGAEDVLGSEGVREILLALNEGLTDEAVARRLGVSERTVRRRVAAVMDLLGASSRFQAGARAVSEGWI